MSSMSIPLLRNAGPTLKDLQLRDEYVQRVKALEERVGYTASQRRSEVVPLHEARLRVQLLEERVRAMKADS
jgi:hypothetical protein